jgi:hypothetical protein
MITRIFGTLPLVALAFYVAWPAWSGYQIKAALDAEDKAALGRKIEFERVRTSLRPTVAAEFEARLAAIVKATGQPQATLDKLKTTGMPKLVDTALVALVSPEGLVRLYKERADVRGEVARIVAEKMASPDGVVLIGQIAGAVGSDSTAVGTVIDKLGQMAGEKGIDLGKIVGGVLGREPTMTRPGAPAGTAGATPDKLGIANVKSFAMSGPLGFSLGIAKDATAKAPDVVADVEFTGGDWKIVGLRPQT